MYIYIYIYILKYIQERRYKYKQERRKKKIMAKSSWYRPSDSVIFVPSTPGSILARQYRDVIDNELREINIKVKVVETSGVSLTRQLFKTDTSGCLIPGCPVCVSSKPRASHTRSGAEYQATCLACNSNNITGFNCAYRLSQHVTDIKKKSRKWALSKHIIDKHHEKANDPGCFEFKCIKIFKKPIDRQCYEGVMINR